MGEVEMQPEAVKHVGAEDPVDPLPRLPLERRQVSDFQADIALLEAAQD